MINGNGVCEGVGVPRYGVPPGGVAVAWDSDRERHMGAWDSGPFDNDGAGDFCADLHDAKPADRVGVLRDALSAAADETDYLEIDVAQAAVAAVAVVAAQRPDGPPVDPDYGPGFLAEGDRLVIPDDLAPLALRALNRVTGDDSEWRELWDEADALDEALATLVPLRAALAG